MTDMGLAAGNFLTFATYIDYSEDHFLHLANSASPIHRPSVASFFKLLKIFSVILLVLVLAASALWLKNRDSISAAIWQHAQGVLAGQEDLLADRTPGELIRYVKRRFEGHPNLEVMALPVLYWVQSQYERPSAR
jgi:hypothetical protein